MNTETKSDDLLPRINKLVQTASAQTTGATNGDDAEPTVDQSQAEVNGTQATELANALALLRSKGFVVPTLAEIQLITAETSDSTPDDDSPTETEYVSWQGSGGSAFYSAEDADRFEQEERERLGRIVEAERTRAEHIRQSIEQAQSIASDIRRVVSRHVRFPPQLADAYAGTLTLWTMHTHVYRAQRVTPYLLITSPTSGAGKSTALEVVASMAHRAELMVNPTAAVVRTVANEGYTILIDEVDELARDSGFRSITNAGYRHGGKVFRIKAGELTRYDVFTPKAFAGIAKEDLPLTGATLDRCIQVTVERANQGETIEPFDPERDAARLTCIRERIEHWAEHAADQLRGATPSMPELPTIRAIEIWKPLVAIAELLGDEWVASARGWALVIEGQRDTAPDPNVRLIQDIHTVLDTWMQNNPYVKFIAVEELVTLRNTLPTRQLIEELSPVQLGKRLGRFGIKSRPVKGVRAYKIRDAGGTMLSELTELFARYC